MIISYARNERCFLFYIYIYSIRVYRNLENKLHNTELHRRCMYKFCIHKFCMSTRYKSLAKRWKFDKLSIILCKYLNAFDHYVLSYLIISKMKYPQRKYNTRLTPFIYLVVKKLCYSRKAFACRCSKIVDINLYKNLLASFVYVPKDALRFQDGAILYTFHLHRPKSSPFFEINVVVYRSSPEGEARRIYHSRW